MKTAEVAIEHVLAGLLALTAFVLPFARGFDFGVADLGTNGVIGVLGAAYMVGVVFDRVADTFLEPRERYLRLEVALPYVDKREGDPFPQDQLEYELRKKGDGRLDWMESLRSRIRTARELTVLGIPATLGAAAFFADTVGWFIGITLVAANLVLIYRVLSYGKRGEETGGGDAGYRTDEYFATHGKDLEQAKKWYRRRSVDYWSIQISSALGALVIAAVSMNGRIAGLSVAGIVIAALARASWIRITKTYLQFVARTELDTAVK